MRSVVRLCVVIVLVAVAPAAASTIAGVRYTSVEWSPDGRSLAVVETGGNLGSLFVLNADGTGLRRIVAPTSGLAGVTWGPDGRRLAFEANDGEIWAVGTDRSALRRLVSSRGGSAFDPAWSPGGRWIAFTRGWLDSAEGDIMAVSPDGRRLLDVTHGTPGGLNAYLGPFWSPDGERLAFTVVDAPDQPPGTIPYVVYVTQFGGHVRQLTRAQIYRGAWAPDGNRIAYTYVDRGRATIRLLDVRRERTHFLHAGASPSWSPDGRRIAFVEDGRVSVMNADGTGVVRLTG